MGNTFLRPVIFKPLYLYKILYRAVILVICNVKKFNLLNKDINIKKGKEIIFLYIYFPYKRYTSKGIDKSRRLFKKQYYHRK